MFLDINCGPVNKKEQQKLQDSHEWIVLFSYFVRGKLKDVYRFTIHKESEYITTRDFTTL